MDDAEVAQELHRMANDPNLVVSVGLHQRLYRAFIGDIHQGYRANAELATFKKALRWLQRQARRLYPDSLYVQELPSRGRSRPHS